MTHKISNISNEKTVLRKLISTKWKATRQKTEHTREKKTHKAQRNSDAEKRKEITMCVFLFYTEKRVDDELNSNSVYITLMYWMDLKTWFFSRKYFLFAQKIEMIPLTFIYEYVVLPHEKPQRVTQNVSTFPSFSREFSLNEKPATTTKKTELDLFDWYCCYKYCRMCGKHKIYWTIFECVQTNLYAIEN